MEQVTITHDTQSEYRAYGKSEPRQQHGRLCHFSFDVYGGPKTERAPADCYLYVEQSWKSIHSKKDRWVSRNASVTLNMTEMMELYAMLGEAIERAQRTQKEAA